VISRRIEGASRVIGKSQGYIGLSIRDVTINCTVNGDATPCMETAWEPTPYELERLNAGASVILRVLGTAHPPVMVEVAIVSSSAELPKPQRRDGKEPCGECHLQVGEVCDICGAVQPVD
jgi:hypothetical protein